MNDKNKVVIGIYKTRMLAEKAVEALKTIGFLTNDISVLMPSTSGPQNFALTNESKASEGAATGASTGAVIGGTLGMLVGFGTLALPGIGPFMAAGPIMAALAGAGLGGAIGGIGGALVGMGIPEYEAKRYEGFIKEGGILLSVHAANSEEVVKAKDSLEKSGAEDISTNGEIKNHWKNRTNAPKDTSFYHII